MKVKLYHHNLKNIFNAETNSFQHDTVNYSKTIHTKDKYYIQAIIGVWFFSFSVIGSIILLIVMANLSWANTKIQCCGFGLGFLLLLLSMIILSIFVELKDKNYEKLEEQNFMEEDEQMQLYNKKELQFAKEWRKNHPTQEIIRQYKEENNTLELARLIDSLH